MRHWSHFLVCALTVLTACTVRAEFGDIGTFVSSARAYSTVSYWIEGNDALVLIDTQFLPSDAIRFVEEAERRIGKKAVAALVLHSNPDKFNGTAALQQRGIKVLTSAQVKTHIPAVHAIRLGWFYEDYQPDYPKEVPNPDTFGDRSTTLRIAGLELRLHVLPVGCSAAHVVVQHGDTLFVGDLVASKAHAWLELGEIDAWLTRLAELKALAPRTVLPGRGTAAGAEALDSTADYLRRVRQLVRAAQDKRQWRWFAIQGIKRELRRAYPDYEWARFLNDGVPAVWDKYATAATR